MTRSNFWRAAFVAAFVASSAGTGFALPDQRVDSENVQLAQAQGTQPRELEPRYKPVPPEEKGWYNSSYIFSLTRGVADSTMVPAAKAPLYVLTVPLDLVLLPFTAIGGMFG